MAQRWPNTARRWSLLSGVDADSDIPSGGCSVNDARIPDNHR